MTVSRMIKEWCKTINLEGNYGAHSLRKTFGYIQRTKFGVGFELICKRFNHSSPSVTMRYLDIEDKEVHVILTHEICLGYTKCIEMYQKGWEIYI